MIDSGSKVKAECSLVLDDGSILFGGENGSPSPLEFTVGSGRIIPLIDGAARSMSQSEERRFSFTPPEAFGRYDPELKIELPADAVPNAEALPVGSYVIMELGGAVHRCKVLAVEGDCVVIDANHELAGHGVDLYLKIIHVDPPRISAVEAEKHSDGCSCGCHELKRQLTGDKD